jgi:hypothetical protein
MRHFERAALEFVEAASESLRPFVWTEPADEVLAEVRRFSKRIYDSDH